MARLRWGAPGERVYEAGVDYGVLYIDEADGVAWNGLVSVSESPSGGDTTPYYYDGIKYLTTVANEEFQATLEAYTYPDEFAECDGTSAIVNGLYVTQQERKSFGLAYRTKIGNDTEGIDYGYKIHLVYNVIAEPSNRDNNSMTESIEPFNFSWQLSTTPQLLDGYRPASHFIIDSRETPEFVLQTLENLLYGTEVTAPRLPPILELLFIFDSYNSSVYDAGKPGDPFFNTIDGGTPSSALTSTADGGTP